MTFADLKNRHADQTITVCGTGPSLDYLDQKSIVGPRIYINRAAFALPYSDGETFWLVLDDAWGRNVKGPWLPFLSSVKFGCGVTGVFRDPLLGMGGFTEPPKGPNIVHFKDFKQRRDDLLGMSREEIATAGALYQLAGTGCTALHFAWYLGASKVRVAGLDGGDGYAKRLRQFYDKDRKGGSGYEMAMQAVRKVISAKGLEVEWVTVPATVPAAPRKGDDPGAQPVSVATPPRKPLPTLNVKLPIPKAQ
jgi:hypothetical protein